MSQDPVQMNVDGVTQLVQSKTNKIPYGSGPDAEGVDSELQDELSLDLSDDELLQLSKKWEGNYRMYEGLIKTRQQANKAYYLGKQGIGTSQTTDLPIASNLLFEAEETFLPAALAKNPEPVVWSDNSEVGTQISSDVKTMLQYHADTLVLRRKLFLVTRHWSIYFLGVMKHGWDNEIKEIKSDVVDPQCLILDPKSCIDSYGDYEGAYIGERKTCTANELIDLFPKHSSYITIMVEGKMGTDVTYTEWWNDDYCFYTFKEKVLDKAKNPHFNYDTEEDHTDEYGNTTPITTPGRNHFAKPKKPYTFLSVFSLGEQPHDITSLIEQNIPNQNRITKRETQIDKNLDNANNSIAFSGSNFNQETAKQGASAMQKGHPVLVPEGKPIQEAIMRFPSPGVPEAFFRASEQDKQDLRSIFGTEGISSQPANENTTARGMILNQQFDNSRIGGGIGDALEQFADNVFNWWVQLYYVYYDQPHFASIMGQMKAVEYIQLQSSALPAHLVISVSPDSMAPKDEITVVNQAIQFFQMGAIGPKTLLTLANFPDSSEAAADGILYKVNPQLYMQLNFPEMAQQMQQSAMQDLQMQAQGTQMQAQAQAQGTAQGTPPEQGTPTPSLSVPPANSSLSNVPLPQ